MSLQEELQKIIKGDAVDDPKVLEEYSKGYSIFKVQPHIIVFPKNKEDVKKLVLFVAENPRKKLSITARSAGTDMSGGCLSESIILDFSKYMNKLKKIGKDYAIVEPGMYYRDFEKATLKKNLLFPSYPASKDICAIGGIVSNNSGGEKSLTFGKTENYVLAYKMILADGNEYTFKPVTKAELDEKLKLKGFEGDIYRNLYKLVNTNAKLLQEAKPKVSKNSAGYALWNVWDGTTFNIPKLICGAQGTLGFTTEVKLRLVKPKKYSSLLVLFLKDLAPVGDLVEKVLEKKPESFESYDDQTVNLAIRFLPDFLKLLGAKSMLQLGFQFLPEFRMLIFGGLPKLILMAEFTGDSQKEVQDKAKDAEEFIKDFGLQSRVTKNAKEVEKYFTIRRKSFSLLHNHAQGTFAAPFIDDVVVQPKHIPEFLPRLNALLYPYQKQKKLVYTIAGHAGDGNFHIIPLMDLSKPEVRNVIKELTPKVHKLVLKYNGSITGEHNDGIIRTPYLQDMYGIKVHKLFEQTKKIFDAKNIFNPGKKVGGTQEYAMSHIITKTD